MKRIEVIEILLGKRFGQMPKNPQGAAFAPANIALCKYWGKRNQTLNLPVTSSLSVSLGKKGTKTKVSLMKTPFDKIQLNGEVVAARSPFAVRLTRFLDLFRPSPEVSFSVDTKTNLPIGAGLASSACGFSALVLALNQLFGWRLNKTDLSIFARLGSGSASRSLWQGFVKWNEGKAVDGLDSFAEQLPIQWPEFCVGLLVLSTKPKALSSRKAMQQTVDTSTLYKAWPSKVAHDLKNIEAALAKFDFEKLGQAAESNALAMHACMLSAWPPIMYSYPETIERMQKVWELRKKGVAVYFTQDAGPSLKLLFLNSELDVIKRTFPEVEVCHPCQR